MRPAGATKPLSWCMILVRRRINTVNGVRARHGGACPFLPGLSPVGGKPVHVAFDGGRLTSDAGVLVLAEIERRLGLAERLARCIEDPRAPERVRHGLAEMIRFRALLIAAGYADANDSTAARRPRVQAGLRPAARERCRPVLAADMCRLENAPGLRAQAHDGGHGRAVL